MLSRQWDIRHKSSDWELQLRRIQISLTEQLPSQLFRIFFFYMYINWEPFQPMLWLAVPSDYKYFSVSPFKLIGSSLFFFFINYNLMNICGIMVPSYTLPDVSFRQTANPQRIAARWLSLSLAVLIFILIIYQDYSDLKNNFLFFLWRSFLP